ncbi:MULTISPECIES: NmrA family NAD(P)-binding protein [Burkholderia]|jgi:NAD(P)H dehydrogenase (quinone)|uniref:NmrA family NAD(P)-binding protein n=2 Tax=Burkholderia contaminans TaxID=488447 RepID=A0A1E3FLN6_9BURK|nr:MULTISPECIES: NmrA family NAD(P)-binding protein [Burkholderia]UTP24696.1 NmrA family NAD(P)-binding protein [Burkholderia sp. FXe9]KKL32269.1 NmrA family transcriptional regulator [Burkholderia contaminans LMG 23361]MBA9834478.1 NmrA family transcriptional regulator [Burkholderia contaminans]MBA9840720.1 NmrA family transcriptional regulator [Burkholderia contaminans]MBA9865758.1 NmrA family transcriptional regulator [Burkholderia contaminans]
MEEQKRYLVTAATGKTGVYTVQQLLDAGHAVRALVHTEDARADALRQLGAEVLVGDLLNHDDSIRATDGMTGAYLCYPVRPGFIQATAYFADAARRAKLDVVVNMSQISAREDSKSHAARDHWIAERVLDWSGVPTVHIRPTFFSEWFVFPWVRDTIVAQGKITLPYGNGRHAPIGAEDQARFISAMLSNPASHVGNTFPLYGPVELGHAQIAEVMSDVLDRKIVYAPSTLREYRQHLETYDLPEFLIQHFEEVAIDYQNGVFAGADNVIAEITGRAPLTIRAFLEANRKVFQG